jgi:glycosyltransferase involved in cell wall biosynthesis
MRILHAPHNIANQAGYIAAALRSMGHEAEVWEFSPSAFAFPYDRAVDISDRNPVAIWEAFEEAIDRFDVFHFHFARSFFSYPWAGMPPMYWDLPILKMLGKKIFFTFHGSDCRIQRIHEEINPWSYFRFSDIKADDERTETNLRVIESFADAMFIVSADYKPFVPNAHVLPRVIDLSEWPVQGPSDRDRPLVLHVPSKRGTKGTSFILDGIEKLRAEGLSFDFALLEGVSHAEARRAIQNADIVVDNVLTGDYEMVSIEAMASSRVAVAYLQDRVKNQYSDLPVFEANPDTFVDSMRLLLQDGNLRRSLGARGRDFVARHHDAGVVAERLVPYYEAPASARQGWLPEWIRMGSAEKLEQLEHQAASLRTQQARTEERATLMADKAKRLEARIVASERWSMKNVVPPPVRASVRRALARRRGGSRRD